MSWVARCVVPSDGERDEARDQWRRRLRRPLPPQLSLVEVRPSARKHGVSDDDIRHAIDNAVAAITRPGQPDFTMLIGPDISARLLEVDVETEDQDYVIHAMAARSKYLTMIDPPRGEHE